MFICNSKIRVSGLGGLEKCFIQEMVYFGILSDQELDIPAFLLSHFKALPRFNPRITRSQEDGAALQSALIDTLEPPTAEELNYLHHPGTENALKAVTHWVMVDLKSRVRKPMENGRHLVQSSWFPFQH